MLPGSFLRVNSYHAPGLNSEEHDVVVLGMFAQEWRGISELQERWE
jgi:hypothetical protein